MVDHVRSRATIRANVGSGKRAVWVTELSSMPRKTKHGAGPSHARGEAEDQNRQKNSKDDVHVRVTHWRY